MIPQIDYSKYIPGFNSLTSSASGNIGQQLSGMPSTGKSRTKAAYFGATSGMPNSGVSNALGYDLYGQEAEQQKQQGFENLLAMLTGYSNTIAPTVGQTIQDSQYQQDFNESRRLSDQARGDAQARLSSANKIKPGFISGPAVPMGSSGEWWLDSQKRRFA